MSTPINRTLKWILVGLVVGLLLAGIGAGSGGASAIFIPPALALGAVLSIIHNTWCYCKDENRKAIDLLPSGVLIFIMCFSILENLKVQTNCISFEGNAYVKARSQVEELGWSHSFLKPKAHELNACELGFEYKNSDHFKLFIVSPDGSVRLND